MGPCKELEEGGAVAMEPLHQRLQVTDEKGQFKVWRHVQHGLGGKQRGGGRVIAARRLWWSTNFGIGEMRCGIV